MTGVDLRRSSEEAHPVVQLDRVIVCDFLVRSAGNDQEQISICPDRTLRWGGHGTELGSRHNKCAHLVVHTVDLDPDVVLVSSTRGLFIFSSHMDLLMNTWLHDTKIPRLLTTRVSQTKMKLMKSPKAMTIRLSEEQAEELETVATVENRPVSEIIRAAIASHVEQRKQDPTFQSSLRDRILRAQRLLQK